MNILPPPGFALGAGFCIIPDMLLQTNAYVVPKDKQDQHARLVRKLKEAMRRIGGNIEVYEQVGPNFSLREEATGRFVQVMRFKDKRQLQQVQQAERADPTCQRLISELCDLIDLPRQMEVGTFIAGQYAGVAGESGTTEE